jgi:hypothetical protein
VEALRWHSLLEAGSRGTFTLQPVVLEYATAQLVGQVYRAMVTEAQALLAGHALVKAQAKHSVRRSQEPLLALHGHSAMVAAVAPVYACCGPSAWTLLADRRDGGRVGGSPGPGRRGARLLTSLLPGPCTSGYIARLSRALNCQPLPCCVAGYYLRRHCRCVQLYAHRIKARWQRCAGPPLPVESKRLIMP